MLAPSKKNATQYKLKKIISYFLCALEWYKKTFLFRLYYSSFVLSYNGIAFAVNRLFRCSYFKLVFSPLFRDVDLKLIFC